MSTTATTSSTSTTSAHSSSSPLPIKPVDKETKSKTNTASTAIPLSTPTTPIIPLASTHEVTAGTEPGSLRLTARPTDSKSTNSAKGSGGSDDDSKGSTYEIVSKIDPKTGKREYSLVWVEVTEKGNPKRFLGYLKLNPTGDHDKPSPAAQAISDLVEAAEEQDPNYPNFKKSSAQTTIKFDGVLEQGDKSGYEIAVLTRGKEKVTLDPMKTPKANLTEKFERFHDEIGKIKKIIKQTGADFDPRDKAADANEGKNKERRDISQEQINQDSLNVYLNRVQQEGGSKIRLQPCTKLTELNSKENQNLFKGVTDKPQFIPVELPNGSYVYLCKDKKDLYYYNPRDAKEITGHLHDEASYNPLKNTICENDSSDIGEALHKFAYNHDIKNLHAPAETHAGSHNAQALGIQWLAHLSKLSPINANNAFFTRTPDAITVPEPSGSDALSAEETTLKKAAAKTAAQPNNVQTIEKPPLPVAQLSSCHEIFDDLTSPTGNPPTAAQKDAWLNALYAVVPKKDGKITPERLQRFRDFVTTSKPKSVSTSSWWPRRSKPQPQLSWRVDENSCRESLSTILRAYQEVEADETPASGSEHEEFHAKVLDNLVKNGGLCKTFCAHTSPWGGVPVASTPPEDEEQDKVDLS